MQNAKFGNTKNAIARMQARIAAVQALRSSKHAARVAARNQQAFTLQMQQLAAQYNVAPEQLKAMLGATDRAARANSATANPSTELVTVNGVSYKPCAAVHALCDWLVSTEPNATRKQMLELCKDNGINASTAATQVGLYRARAKAAADAAQ